ncbi:MAG: flagellar basal body-associated FliL family protein [Actinomycetota bacterium]
MAKKKKKEEGEEEEEKGGGGKMKIIGGVVGAIVVYRFVLAPAPAPTQEGMDQAAIEQAAAELAAERAVPVEGLIFPMEEIIVNLADDDANRYLRVGLALVLEEGVALETIEPEAARAIDAAIEYLSAQSFETLRESGSKTRIRDELSTSIREAYDGEMVVRVLLTTFVMQ